MTRLNGTHQNIVCHYWFLFVFVIIIRTQGSRHAQKHVRAIAQTRSHLHKGKHMLPLINRHFLSAWRASSPALHADRKMVGGEGGRQRTSTYQASPVWVPQTKVPKCMDLFTSQFIWGHMRRLAGWGVRTDRMSTWMKLSRCGWLVNGWSSGQLEMHNTQRSGVSDRLCVFLCMCLFITSSASHSASDLTCSGICV